LTSGVDYKYCHTVRQPIGVAGLIVPANTPIANIVWKTFPALICGNSVVLKASEDAPETAQLFASITKLGGLPDGIFNVIYGRGEVSGNILVSNTKVDIVSFTGSTSVGKIIGEICGKRLAKVSLELGGKNPFVVWEDANLNLAVKWAVLSAFSNAGQRCAAGSRILIHSNIYEKFKNLFVDATKKLKIGNDDNSDLGPVINQRQYDNINKHITEAINEGGKIISGGNIPDSKIYKGYYIEPTIIEGLSRDSKIVNTEMFGPLVTLHKVDNLEEALDFANSTEFGLTAAIHTKNINHAMWFVQNVKAGVANVNMGTYGSEPHMPFGGVGASGNGTREPGVEAINIYSELKNISIQIDI
jgi:aldehyde dehydrogenase (NAD+)